MNFGVEGGINEEFKSPWFTEPVCCSRLLILKYINEWVRCISPKEGCSYLRTLLPWMYNWHRPIETIVFVIVIIVIRVIEPIRFFVLNLCFILTLYIFLVYRCIFQKEIIDSLRDTIEVAILRIININWECLRASWDLFFQSVPRAFIEKLVWVICKVGRVIWVLFSFFSMSFNREKTVIVQAQHFNTVHHVSNHKTFTWAPILNL